MGTVPTIQPLEATFGAMVYDIELRTMDDDACQTVRNAWLDYALLIFPGQFLTRDEQNDFARRFGDLEFEASPISNLDRNGEVITNHDHDTIKSIRGNEGWHFDSTYMPVQAKGAVFTAEIVPGEGAATGWADMRAAYDALDPATKERIGELEAHHSLYYSQGRSGYLPTKESDGSYSLYGYHNKEVSVRPLVKVHPETGRTVLLTGRHAHDIVGMDPAESERFLDELLEDACQPPRIHHHQWTVGDAVRQPMPDAPGDPVRSDTTSPDVAHPDSRGAVLGGRQQPSAVAVSGARPVPEAAGPPPLLPRL